MINHDLLINHFQNKLCLHLRKSRKKKHLEEHLLKKQMILKKILLILGVIR